MRKNYKRITAMLMTSAIALSAGMTAVTSYAADSSIKINSTAEGTHTYKAYQLLTGTLSTDGKALGDVAFGDNLPAITAGLANALKDDTVFGAADVNIFKNITASSTAADFADALSNLSTEDQKREFAKIIGRYVENAGTTVSSNATPVDDGYYIIKEISAAPDNQAKTLNMLRVEGNTVIDTKESAPESDKTVDDINDSTGESDTGKKSADYDIGDDIPYTLTFTLPSDYSSYSKYPVTFLDDMCKGLTLNAASAKIWYGKVEGAGKSISFESTASPASETEGTMYKYEIADLKTDTDASSLKGGDTITIKYTAKLNDNAVIGSTGNINKYKVVFANDPNWLPPSVTPGTPENPDTPGTPPENPPTSETPVKQNVVFTYNLVIDKVDEESEPLTGADFTLYKWIPDPEGDEEYNSVKGAWTAIDRKEGTSAGSEFTFKGLDDGIYKLSETKTPTGYNTITPKVFTISAAHSDTALTELKSTGDLAITGVNGVLTAEIDNKKGVTLPGTGGMGVALFYTAGSLLIAGGATLLITKKRMNAKEK